MRPTHNKRIFRSLASLLGLVAVAGLGHAAAVLAEGPAADAAPPPPAWTVDDLILTERAPDLQLAPDGKLAVWARSYVGKTSEGEERRSDLWLTSTDGSKPRPLTRGRETATSPRFSPDGKRIGFLSDRKHPGHAEGKSDIGERQVWILPVDGGEAYPVTRLPRAVRIFAWIDADTLLVAAQEPAGLDEQTRKKKKDGSIVVDGLENNPPVRLFRVGIEDHTVRRLTTNHDWIGALAVSPDGRHAVITAQRSLSYQFDQKIPPRTALVDLESGAERPLLAGSTLLPGAMQWAPDGSGFYFVNSFSSHPRYRMATVEHLHFHPLSAAGGDGKGVEMVPLDWERGLGNGYTPTPDGVIVLLAHGVQFSPVRYWRTPRGWKHESLTGEHISGMEQVRVSRDGQTMAYRYSRAVLPARWFAARLRGSGLRDPQPLTALNAGYGPKPTGAVEVIHWQGARGETVEGLLHHPLDETESGARQRPLILQIHGGPAGTDRNAWVANHGRAMLLYRQRGAYVLQVNYHGSAGYGLDWVESIGDGNYYNLEPEDLENGVDDLISRGLVDPERLGIVGWSNGGILAAELITRSRRYKAASIGAADVEWISDWANVDFGAAFDNYYLGGNPLEKTQVYLDKSPFFRLPQVTTPTIIFTGSEDRNVPPHQSWSLFRVLQQTTDTPVRFVLFPGEPHSLRKIAHQRRKLTEELAWMDRYLFDDLQEPPAALQKPSLLAGLLARRGAARHDGVLGRMAGSVLVPETVLLKGVEVGRFEITRAQFAAFSPDHAASQGPADAPATGITFQEARDYATWLAERTGRPFRLPTVAEAEKLAAAAGSSGNTLDRWAGYTPNLDDSEALGELLGELGDPAPLLLAVGSLAGTGEPMVFDLDGNAAEWAANPQGRGIPSGACAALPAGATGRQPPPPYIGMRVMIGPIQP
ncbi:MAG: prolyl oligopeptidase family serine peptidase [Acidobacteria bacterium]|nr:prolyl oligopeptidase family serine peptidase [Acidobacteriota bacterium]